MVGGATLRRRSGAGVLSLSAPASCDAAAAAAAAASASARSFSARSRPAQSAATSRCCLATMQRRSTSYSGSSGTKKRCAAGSAGVPSDNAWNSLSSAACRPSASAARAIQGREEEATRPRRVRRRPQHCISSRRRGVSARRGRARAHRGVMRLRLCLGLFCPCVCACTLGQARGVGGRALRLHPLLEGQSLLGERVPPNMVEVRAGKGLQAVARGRGRRVDVRREGLVADAADARRGRGARGGCSGRRGRRPLREGRTGLHGTEAPHLEEWVQRKLVRLGPQGIRAPGPVRERQWQERRSVAQAGECRVELAPPHMRHIARLFLLGPPAGSQAEKRVITCVSSAARRLSGLASVRPASISRKLAYAPR